MAGASNPQREPVNRSAIGAAPPIGDPTDYPFLHVTRQTLQELVEAAKECCIVRELTAEERVQYGLPPR